VLDVAARHGARAVRIGRPASFAWYTGGADNRVDHAADRGVAEVVISAEGEWVVTSNVEVHRLREEELANIETVAHPWLNGPDQTVRSLVGDGAVSDADPGIASELAKLRLVLDDDAHAQYRLVGRDARAAMEEAAASLRPDLTELDAAAALDAACRRRGLHAPVVLVAGSSRVVRFRHPLPTTETIGDRVMVVVCAERHGLYANLTRFVFFDPPDAETEHRLRACADILTELRGATRAGRTLGDLFALSQSLYDDVGFPGEWREHHQGGLTGYQSREVVATPGSPVEIAIGQAFAWNPSVPGAKAEETFLLRPDGPEVITG
jgi:Xaa-Pro aminopeptidase